MRPTRITIPIVVVLAVMLATAAQAMAFGTTRAADIPYDGTPDLKNVPAPYQNFPVTIAGAAAAAPVALHNGEAPDLVLTLYSSDPAHPGAHDVAFWKEFSGAHSDIYVGWNDLQAPPPLPQDDHTLTPEQLTYMGEEFDARIWESDVFHFGNYLPRSPRADIDGTRAAIFVYNIRDEAYYDADFPWYTAGYFSKSMQAELDLNCLFIDSLDWANRIGPDSARPYLYEGVIAHEFTHLINSDVDGNEEGFIDEGFACLAEQLLYGTAPSAGQIGEYLVYNRDSLVTWNGAGLEDYGSATLWQDYLWENAGGGELSAPLADRVAPGFEGDKFAETDAKFADSGDAFIWNLNHRPTNGLASIAELVGGMPVVEQMHRDWTLANLLDGRVNNPKWNYRSLELGGADSDFYTIEDGIAFYKQKVGGNMPPTRKNVWRRTVTEPWGAYYRSYAGSAPGVTMTFAGEPQTGVAPAAGSYEWYGGTGAMLDVSVSRLVSGVIPGGKLAFKTWYDIEDQWDYGYVEASADGVTWVKLEQLSKLPMATGDANGSGAYDGPGALTGSSAGWQDAEFSFGALSGDVWVRFRYRTDEAVNGVGWYVDDVHAGTYVDDDTVAGWVNDGWQWTDGMQTNDWSADAFVPFAQGRKKGWSVVSIVPVAGQGTTGEKRLDSHYMKNFRIIGVVANRPTGVLLATGRLTIAK
jgi:hypothetical protein